MKRDFSFARQFSFAWKRLRRLSTTKRRLIKIMAEEHERKLDGVFEAISPFHGVLGPAG